MKQKFAEHYQSALLAFLNQSPRSSLRTAHGRLGQQALTVDVHTLDIAKLHEHILVTQVLPGRPAGQRALLTRQAGAFFAEAIIQIKDILSGTRESAVQLNQIVEMLSQRTVELAASNQELKVEVAQRKAAEEALKKSEHHYSQLLARSDRLQEQLRQLSCQILLAQEEERKEISRELHDVIAQTLTGINVRLATLAKEAALNTKGLDRNIARTQRLVAKSVDIVHQFARQLRPAALDDLGLIPALHSFMKGFTARSGVRTHLKVFAQVERLDAACRTVLFRVAQEALTNVARHAQATRADVTIEKRPDGICMRIKDNGKSFRVEPLLQGAGSKRLGLLGMRERMEMVGGRFSVESAPRQGTTVIAQLLTGCGKTDRARVGSTTSLHATP